MPLAKDEFADLAVEVSLLEPPRRLAAMDERQALAQLRPGIDGVVLECGAHRATFLPQVWDQLPDPFEFLGALKRKAGLSARYWGDDVRISSYEVRKFASEPALP
jgi:AmmeMemoRadiSam system protein A